MSDNSRIMTFTKRHFNVKPNTARVTCRLCKRAPLLKESSDGDMQGGEQGETFNLTQVKMSILYTACSSKCKYGSGGRNATYGPSANTVLCLK